MMVKTTFTRSIRNVSHLLRGGHRSLRTILLASLWLSALASAQAEQVTRRGAPDTASATGQARTQAPHHLGTRQAPAVQSTPTQTLAKLNNLLERASSTNPMRDDETESLISSSHAVFQDVLREELRAHRALRPETARQLVEFTARMLPRDPNGTVVDNLLVIMENRTASAAIEREIRTLDTNLRAPLEREIKEARASQNVDGN